jgi:predicted molibdopterin-dependent oxidoreductase YjgC
VSVVGCPAGYVTGSANELGAAAMGVGPNRFPGGASVDDAKARDSFGKRWGARLSTRAGLSVQGMMEAARQGKLQGLIVMGSDLATAVPGAPEALRNLRFLVVLDLFLNATAAMADVVLPAASSAESDGILISLANRVQLQRAAVPPPGQARPDWSILSDLGEMMQSDESRHGKSDAWRSESAEDVWREAVRSTPEFRDMSYSSVGAFGKARVSPTARPKFVAVAQPATETSREFPMLLSVGRTFWDKGTVLSESAPVLSAVGEAWLEMNPADATQASLKDGDSVKVTTSAGERIARLAVTAGVTPGCVWMARNLTEKPVSQMLAHGGELTRVRVAKA